MGVLISSLPSHLSELRERFFAFLRRPFRIVLLIGLVQGLIYTFLIPPWWHYDEPGHFEFAWQIVHFDHWPRKGEFDEQMRRKMAQSMDYYKYYKPLRYKLDLNSNEPVFVGAAPQTSDYPLYYLIASLPLRLLTNADFAVQNRAVRLMSLGMFLLTLWVIWKALGELLPERHPLRWMTLLFLALLPGFADVMTAISDDVGAVLAFSLFLWAGLRLIQRGFSWRRLIALITTLVICFWTKETTWTAFGLAPVALLFAIFQGKKHWVAWTLLFAAALALIFYVVRWGDARYWYRIGSQASPIRQRTPDAPLGEYVFKLEQGTQIGQFVPVEEMRPLRRKTVTLGLWMWASEPVQVSLPVLRMTIYKGGLLYSPEQWVFLGTTPAFYSVNFEIPYEAEYGWLEWNPRPSSENVLLFFDGIVLTDGMRRGIPSFPDVFAIQGIWDNQPFRNHVRNASAEWGMAWLNPKLVAIAERAGIRGDLNVFFASLQDWAGSRRYYQTAASVFFRTFWIRTARDKVDPLGGSYLYSFLQLVTAVSVFGILASVIMRRKRSSLYPAIFFLGLAGFSEIALAFQRGGGELLVQSPTVPWARYAMPAIVVMALFLVAGWYRILSLFGPLIHLSPVKQQAIFVVFMAWIDFWAMLSVAKYFYWGKGEELLVLFLLLLSLTLLLVIPRLPLLNSPRGDDLSSQ